MFRGRKAQHVAPETPPTVTFVGGDITPFVRIQHWHVRTTAGSTNGKMHRDIPDKNLLPPTTMMNLTEQNNDPKHAANETQLVSEKEKEAA